MFWSTSFGNISPACNSVKSVRLFLFVCRAQRSAPFRVRRAHLSLGACLLSLWSRRLEIVIKLSESAPKLLRSKQVGVRCLHFLNRKRRSRATRNCVKCYVTATRVVVFGCEATCCLFSATSRSCTQETNTTLATRLINCRQSAALS